MSWAAAGRRMSASTIDVRTNNHGLESPRLRLFNALIRPGYVIRRSLLAFRDGRALAVSAQKLPNTLSHRLAPLRPPSRARRTARPS